MFTSWNRRSRHTAIWKDARPRESYCWFRRSMQQSAHETFSRIVKTVCSAGSPLERFSQLKGNLHFISNFVWIGLARCARDVKKGLFAVQGHLYNTFRS